VAPGVYRSGQMGPGQLGRTIKDRGIKTVLNLRGSHPEQEWYAQERDTTLASGAIQVDVAMSSCEWMSRSQLRSLVDVLETCERPVLIHCQHGSERTGWVSAVSELLRPGSDLEHARRQLSLRYLYIRAGDAKVMALHLEQYEHWLNWMGWRHTPDRFRAWVAEGFQPGSPSRELWPYDPYPLVVVTEPPGTGESKDVVPAAALP
jgi:protein tyrosine phosphatase (PTP) superfamily phosphohydrolase (DUF442 family)